MIRLGFMTDAARVIGASTEEGDERRRARVPAALPSVMQAIHVAPYAVVGASSAGPWREHKDTHVFVLSHDRGLGLAPGHMELVNDYRALVDRFEHSDDELLVAGGHAVFQLFLPYAQRLDVAVTDALVPGDVTFADWDGRFRLEGEETWDGGKTLRYRRRGVRMDNAVSLYLDGIRDGRAREAITRYSGARYTQHSTGVRDGVAGFVHFFESFIEQHPDRDVRVVRAIEDGRHVFLQVSQELDGGAARWVTTDLFDTDDVGRIVEHWDVISALEDPAQLDGPREAVDLVHTERNKALVRSFLVDVHQNGRLDRIAELVDEDVRQHEPGLDDGRDAYAKRIRAARRSGERYDFVFKVVGEGSLVVSYAKVDAPSGDRAVFEIWRVQDGRIAERWVNAERIGPREQWVNSGKF